MKILVHILLMLHLIVPPAKAQGGQAVDAAVVFVGALAGATAITATGYYGWIAKEVKDWIDPETGTTAALNSQCGLAAEARLLRNNRANYLFFALKNENAETRVLKPEEIRIIFPNGRERLATVQQYSQHSEIKPHWRVIGLAPFPEKHEFKNQDSLIVEIPLYAQGDEPICTVTVPMKRNPSVPTDERTTVSYTVMDMTFDLGAVAFRSKNLNELGSDRFSMSLNIYGYPALHHGFYLGVGFEDYGGDQNKLRATTGASLSGTTNLSGAILSAGYTYRAFLGRHWSLSTDLGPAYYGLTLYGGGRSAYDEGYFAGIARLNLDYRFARVLSGFFFGDYAVGLSVYDYWIFNGSFGTLPASGSSLGAALRLRIGF